MTEGYKQTEIGVIPEDWSCVKLLSKCDLLNGLTYVLEDTSDYGTLVIRSSNIQNNQLDFCDNIYVKLNVPPEKCIKKDDIIICVRNGSAALIGKTAKADKDYPNATFGAFMAVLRGDNNDYIFQLFQQGNIQKRIINNSGATINQITNGDFKSIIVPFPDNRLEQMQIAEALSDVDELIASLEKLIAKKKVIKQGAMQELLTGKRRLPGFSGEWDEDTFENLFEILPNNAYTREQLSLGGNIKDVHYGDILTKYGAILDGERDSIPTIIKELETKKRTESAYIQSGDIIIADTAEDETVGKAVEVINVTGRILSGQHTFFCRPKAKFAPMFLGYYINSEGFHSQMLPFITGTKVSSINKASLNTLKVRFPCVQEQEAIAGLLYDMDNEAKVIEQKISKAHQIKQGMMQQLLTGKIRLLR